MNETQVERDLELHRLVMKLVELKGRTEIVSISLEEVQQIAPDCPDPKALLNELVDYCHKQFDQDEDDDESDDDEDED